MNMINENYSGNPRVFAAAFAKDITVAMIENYEGVNIVKSFLNNAETIESWITEDPNDKISDDQITYIESLISTSKLNAKEYGWIDVSLLDFTKREANGIIALLKRWQKSPEERGNMGQKEIMQALKRRTDRED